MGLLKRNRVETTKPSKVIKKPKIEKSNPSKLKIEAVKKAVKEIVEAPDVDAKTQLKSKKSKYIMPSQSVTDHIVDECLNVLQQLIVLYKKKNTILEDENSIFAEIHCIKIQSSRGNIKFVLPHSTAASSGEICLITPDMKKGKKVDHEPTIEHWEELLSKAGVKNIKTVLPMRQLRVEYDQYELKRRLLTQHDFIMVDTRVLNHVSHLLGKLFFKKHNMLIPVRLNEKGDLKKDIDVGLRTAILRMNDGETSTLIVGHTAMPQKHLKENILSMVQQLNTRYPGGEANIRSICIKLPLSLSLPLYLTLRPSKTVIPPKMRRNRSKHFKLVEGELSTIPNSTVRVAPDGTVHLDKSKIVDSDRDTDIEDAADEKQEQESEDSD